MKNRELRVVAQVVLGDLAFKGNTLILRSPWQLSRIVGHREGDIDFCCHLFQLSPRVTNVHYCHIFSDPGSAVSPSISLKRISLFGLWMCLSYN
jgi:hypothetical protein